MTDRSIEIYGRKLADGRDCPHCVRARDLLDRRQIAFTYFDISNDEGLSAEFATRTNGTKTVPQIFVGIHRIGGADDLERGLKVGSIQQIIGGR